MKKLEEEIHKAFREIPLPVNDEDLEMAEAAAKVARKYMLKAYSTGLRYTIDIFAKNTPLSVEDYFRKWLKENDLV